MQFSMKSRLKQNRITRDTWIPWCELDVVTSKEINLSAFHVDLLSICPCCRSVLFIVIEFKPSVMSHITILICKCVPKGHFLWDHLCLFCSSVLFPGLMSFYHDILYLIMVCHAYCKCRTLSRLDKMIYCHTGCERPVLQV